MMMFKLLTGFVIVSLAVFAGNERLEKIRVTKKLRRTNALLVPLAMQISVASYKYQKLQQQNDEQVEKTNDLQEMLQQLKTPKPMFDSVTAAYARLYNIAATLFASKSADSHDEPSPAPLADPLPYDPILLVLLSLSVSPPPFPPLPTEPNFGSNLFAFGKSDDYSLQQAFDIVLNALTDLLHKFSALVVETFCMAFHERTMSPLSVASYASVDGADEVVKKIAEATTVWISFGLLVVVLSRVWLSVASCCAKQRRDKSIVCIQSAARRYLAVKQMKAATIKLQCFIRYMAALSKKNSLIMAKQQDLAAATKIQRLARAYLARLQFKSTMRAVVVIQSIVRVWYVLRVAQRRSKSIICIQSTARRYLAVKQVKVVQDLLLQDLAATKIQRIARGYLVCLQVKSTMRAVVAVQSVVRVWHVLRVVLQLRRSKAIIGIQSAARRYLAVKQVTFLKALVVQQRDPRREAAIAEFVPLLPFFLERCKDIMNLPGTATFQDVEEWYRECVARIELFAPIGARLVENLRYTSALKDRILGLLQGENFDMAKTTCVVEIRSYMRTCSTEELETLMSSALEYLQEIDGTERELQDLLCNEQFLGEIDASVQESFCILMHFMELDSDATLRDVKKRYRRLGLRYHPDMQGGSGKAFRYLSAITLALEPYLHEKDYEGDGSTTLGMVESRVMDDYRSQRGWYDSAENIVARLRDVRAELKEKAKLPENPL